MIEIEKKFLLTQEQQINLLDGAQKLGSKLVEDSYLDTDQYSLTTQDLWFRERDGAYELKAPLKAGSGSYVATNQYHEITDVEEIARALEFDPALNFETSLASAGIKKFMTVFTSRTSYEKEGFHIDVDTATYQDSVFEYAIAEIELLIHEESDASNAESRIIAFAKTFDLTTDQVVLGKVAAYLKAENPTHYEALVSARVLK